MKKNKKKQLTLLISVIAAIVIIFAFLLVMVLGVYKFNWNNRVFTSVSNLLPFPAVYVNGAGSISVNEIKADLNSVKKFYESQDFEQIGMRVDFGTDQGEKRLKVKEKEVINKLIENKIILSLAQKRGIEISDQAVDAEVENNIQQYGNREKLISDLARLYGWTFSDFKQQVVKPELYAEKLSEAYANEVDTSTQLKKAQSLWERVAKNKEDFAKVASIDSEGQSSQGGGDLGWSTKDQLIQAVSDKAFAMKPGEVSEAIESPLGFHIIKLEEKKTEDDQDLVHIRQIFVKKTTFADWLKEKTKDYNITIFLKDYAWNKDSELAEFTDSGMKQFESSLGATSQGDPSVFP
ncbi:MAG: peptidylprolyl isomerase [Parcubacteria group bacterium]|jgi:parvulin-like peptidyl-prolyl isomerase